MYSALYMYLGTLPFIVTLPFSLGSEATCAKPISTYQSLPSIEEEKHTKPLEHDEVNFDRSLNNNNLELYCNVLFFSCLL